MRWRDVEVGDTVVSVCSPTVCTLLERDGRMYTWFIVHDDFQRPGTVFTTEASFMTRSSRAGSG